MREPLDPESVSWNSNVDDVAAWVRTLQLPQGAIAERVGDWMWIEFSEKPPEELRKRLRSAGFRWIDKRGKWAHCGGHPTRHSKDDPRSKYECELIAA